MSFTLPYPTTPTNGQTGDATPILANFVAIQQAIASFDGSQLQSKSVTEAALADAINPRLRYSETLSNFVQSGCVWTAVSGLQGTMTGGTVYVSGYRVIVSGVGSNTFDASKDVYVDVDYLGNITYNEVSNGSSAPSLAVNSVRLAKVITGASSISSIIQSDTDGGSNPIYPTSSIGADSWLVWTPSFTNLTIGNGSLNCRYSQIGKTVDFTMIITLGSTSSVGSNACFSLPVNNNPTTYNTNILNVIGHGWGNPAGTNCAILAAIDSTSGVNNAQLLAQNASGTYLTVVGFSSSVPGTWANGNAIFITGTYEAI